MRRYSGAGDMGGGDMKIREGAYYRARNRRIFGPMGSPDFCERYPWAIGILQWDENGRCYQTGTRRDEGHDLISEVYVSDTPPADAPAPETKTLRDEFAMEAMKILIPRQEQKDETFAELAYIQADAMMEARKK
jgi:hypothetical protein